MPIDSERYEFTDENVAEAPAKHGVYQLEENGTITYIGRASGTGVTIRSRLQSHKSGAEGRCTAIATHYRREVCSDPITREKQLQNEYKLAHGGRLPRCNERVG